jgi:hypothetical protein
MGVSAPAGNANGIAMPSWNSDDNGLVYEQQKQREILEEWPST